MISIFKLGLISIKFVDAFKNIASVFDKNRSVKRTILSQMKEAGMSRRFVKKLNFKFSNKMWRNCSQAYKRIGIVIQNPL